MEDVLLAYLRSRQNLGQAPVPPLPESASGTDAKTLLPTAGSTTVDSAPSPTESAPSPTGSSWVIPAADRDPFLKSALPFPLCALVSLVETHAEYPDSVRRLAELLKKISGTHSLDEALLQVMQARLPRVWMERFLFILLEVQPSDWQTAHYALQFRHVRRLLLRVDRKQRLNAAESTLAREIIHALNLQAFADLDGFCVRAVATFKEIQAHRPAASADLGLLIYLLRCETASMGERKAWLEGELAPEDPGAIARLTPHLKLLEDRIQRTRELAQRLGRYEPPRDAPMGLEDGLGPYFFNHLRECLGRRPELAPLLAVLDLQRSRLVPTQDLVALATFCRWAQESRGTAGAPLDWIRAALEAYDGGHFRVDVRGAMPGVAPLIAEGRMETDGDVALGNFGENPYACWIARDGLTRPFRSQNPDRLAPDIRHTVLCNIHRDGILLRLLDTPAAQGAPGLIETVVENSKSPAVHARIATRPELHSGPVNRRVPIALLKSQVSIPIALVRTLVHPSYVPFPELKSLFRSRSTLRAEVADEIGRYLRQIHAL